MPLSGLRAALGPRDPRADPEHRSVSPLLGDLPAPRHRPETSSPRGTSGVGTAPAPSIPLSLTSGRQRRATCAKVLKNGRAFSAQVPLWGQQDEAQEGKPTPGGGGGLFGPQHGHKPTSRRQAQLGQEKPGLPCLGWSLNPSDSGLP